MRKKRGLIIVSSLLIACLLLSAVAYLLIVRRTREVANSNWSMHGEWIVFSCAPRGGSRSSLYLVRPDGSELTRLTTDEIVAVSPSWSPDGEEILFENYSGEIYKLPRGSRDLIPLSVSDQRDRDELFPIWSPDGQRIALVSRHDEEYDLIRVNVKDGTQETMVRDVERGPITWSPDGQWIAYQSTGEIRKVRVDGGETQTIVKDRYGKRPAWSPDGRLIAFEDYTGTNVIYVIHEDGSQKTQLTDLPAASFYPAWSPDGQWIVFVSSFERPDTQLFKMRPDGSELQRIVDTDCSAFSPDWVKMPGE